MKQSNEEILTEFKNYLNTLNFEGIQGIGIIKTGDQLTLVVNIKSSFWKKIIKLIPDEFAGLKVEKYKVASAEFFGKFFI